MGLERLALGTLSSLEATIRGLKRVEHLLGHTPTYGASRTVTANTTALDSDDLILGDTTSGSITITLPPADQNLGRRFTAKKKAAANTLTLDANGSELIDGAATLAWTTNQQSYTVQSDGVGWQVV